jgi:hypothetical protein
MPDTALADAARTNLLLVGTPTSNVWLERWQDRLLVRYDGNRAIVNGTPWGLADHGVVWAAASPADGQHSIVVCSGMRSRGLNLPRSVYTVASDCMIVGPGRDEFRIERLGSRP